MVALVRLSQVSDADGPLNQWPPGQRILALSTGPSDDWTAYLCSTSAGSPHLTAPCSSIYAGQSMKIMPVSIATPIPAGRLAAHAPGPDKSSTGKEHSLAHLIHPRRHATCGMRVPIKTCTAQIWRIWRWIKVRAQQAEPALDPLADVHTRC
jgi:hypothetical protein